MSVSADDPTVVIVDPLPLRNLGLVAVLDRLAPTGKFRLASLNPDDTERLIRTGARYGMIIYNVGGDSVAEHRHLKRIKALRMHAANTPLLIFSDRNNLKEVWSAMTAGARGFLYAGTTVQLAQQALSFILDGGSYFPAAMPLKRGRLGRRTQMMECASVESAREETVGKNGQGPASPNADLTERQRAVLERLGRGDSNKAIARGLGIREATVKVHVRQIMRKLGLTNRTQVAIACAGSGAEGRL